MAFTNNRIQFYDQKSFNEVQFASGLAKGMSSFVTAGLELTGTTLTSGTFNNSGAFGQLGNVNETEEINSNYTGFVLIRTSFAGQYSTSGIEYSPTYVSSTPWTSGGDKLMTLYELDAGVIVNDYRHIEYVKSFYWELAPEAGVGFVRQVLNGFRGEAFNFSGLGGSVTSVNTTFPDVLGNVETVDLFRVNLDQTDLTPVTVATYQEVIDFVKLKAGNTGGGSLDTGGGNAVKFDVSIQEKNLMVFIDETGTSAEMKLDGRTLSKTRVTALLNTVIALENFMTELIFEGKSYASQTSIPELEFRNLWNENYRGVDMVLSNGVEIHGTIAQDGDISGVMPHSSTFTSTFTYYFGMRFGGHIGFSGNISVSNTGTAMEYTNVSKMTAWK